VEVPEFSFRYVCGGGAAGVAEKSRRFCVNFIACRGFTCSFFCRTCGEKQSLCDVLVWSVLRQNGSPTYDRK